MRGQSPDEGAQDSAARQLPASQTAANGRIGLIRFSNRYRVGVRKCLCQQSIQLHAVAPCCLRCCWSAWRLSVLRSPATTRPTSLAIARPAIGATPALGILAIRRWAISTTRSCASQHQAPSRWARSATAAGPASPRPTSACPHPMMQRCYLSEIASLQRQSQAKRKNRQPRKERLADIQSLLEGTHVGWQLEACHRFAQLGRQHVQLVYRLRRLVGG